MKKLILAMFFVFATGTIMNASSKSIQTIEILNPDDESDCHDIYVFTRDYVTAISGSLYVGITAAIAAEEACMEEEEDLESVK
jgi:hypothetical protein